MLQYSFRWLSYLGFFVFWIRNAGEKASMTESKTDPDRMSCKQQDPEWIRILIHDTYLFWINPPCKWSWMQTLFICDRAQEQIWLSVENMLRFRFWISDSVAFWHDFMTESQSVNKCRHAESKDSLLPALKTITLNYISNLKVISVSSLLKYLHNLQDAKCDCYLSSVWAVATTNDWSLLLCYVYKALFR